MPIIAENSHSPRVAAANIATVADTLADVGAEVFSVEWGYVPGLGYAVHAVLGDDPVPFGSLVRVLDLDVRFDDCGHANPPHVRARGQINGVSVEFVAIGVAVLRELAVSA